MLLLELARDYGLDLKRTPNAKGGEYHSACPKCGEGFDRFIMWPSLNRYWCRRCDTKGDAIQFCREFLSMSFREACQIVKNEVLSYNFENNNQQLYEKPLVANEPLIVWQEKASVFVNWAQTQLEKHPEVRKNLKHRGFQDETIESFKLGYCADTSSIGIQDFYRERSSWGLLNEYRDDGKKKKLWLPQGIVIPTLSSSGFTRKLKIRRTHWHKDDYLPKYVEVSGSKQSPSVYGDTNLTVAMIIESELDSMLIQQEARDLCFCIGLGGSTKKPDVYTDQLLRTTQLILWSLDNNEAGKKEAFWWRKRYSQLRFWPAPIGKSPGDALKDHGINLCDWISEGIEYYSKVQIPNESALKAFV
jgi:DNA primase